MHMENIHYQQFKIRGQLIGLLAKVDSMKEEKQKLQGQEATIHLIAIMGYTYYPAHLIMELA